MGDDPILKKKVTAAEFAAIKATQPFTKLQMPIEWWLEHSNVDAAGVSYPPVNTSGQALVTEASAATSLGHVAYMRNMLTSVQAETFTRLGNTPATNDSIYAQHCIAVVPFVSDGAGAVAFTAVVPALAGYTGHMRWLGTWFDTTDAAVTITWSVAAGTIIGPAVHAIATTANSVTQAGAVAANQVGLPIPLRGTIAADDNKAMGVAMAGYGNTNTGYVIVEYWYET